MVGWCGWHVPESAQGVVELGGLTKAMLIRTEWPPGRCRLSVMQIRLILDCFGTPPMSNPIRDLPASGPVIVGSLLQSLP